MEKQEKQSKKSPTKDTGLKEASQPAKSTQPKQAVAESFTSAKGNNVAKTVALVVILALVALAGFFVIRYFLALKNPPVAVLEGETAMRMGQSQVLTFDSKDIMQYMAAVCEAARDPQKVRLGPSPRALLALLRCCQALAAIRGRDYVIPDDVKELAVPVLAHRIVLRGVGSQNSAEDFVKTVLESVKVPTEERK